MITRITLRDIASFDQEGVTFDNLQKVNYIYGGNGTGKTTLSKVLGYAGQTYNVKERRSNDGRYKDCRVDWDSEILEVLTYNRDFKERNLQEDIPGVFTIGEEYIKTENSLDHWRLRRIEYLRTEAAAYKGLKEVNDKIKAEELRLLDTLWEKYYLPYSDLVECMKGYAAKVSFAERLKHYVNHFLPSSYPILHFHKAEEFRKHYKVLFIDESDGPENLMAEKLRLERELLTNELWYHLAELAQRDVEAYYKVMNGLNEQHKNCVEHHDETMRMLSQVDNSIRSTESLISTLKPSIERINNALCSYGFSGFSILPSPKVHNHYQIQRNDGSYASSSLSEGEQTFITFLYYMQLVKGMTTDTDIDTRRVLVIDDPISSLDSSVIYVVYTMLRNLINEVIEGKSNVKQLFVLTHNTEFHRLLSQRKRCRDVHYWKLVKSNNVTKALAYGEDNPVKTDYEMQWEELRCLGAGHNVHNAPNAMRKILETYFVRLGGYDKYKIVNDLFVDGTENKEIAESLLKWMDEGIHGSIQALYSSLEEMNEKYLSVFKELFVKLGHEAHYKMMMRIY